jgi:hypothetical protein
MMFNSTFPNTGWVKLKTILAGGPDHQNSHGLRYVIRSIDFAAFDKLFPRA